MPVLENFGFRVLEETPTPARAAAATAMSTISTCRCRAAATPAAGAEARARWSSAAIAAVLEGKAENDPFNQLIVAAGLEPREVALFRAWFRYLRQTGLSYSLVTVVDALRRAPEVTKGLIALFDAMHDPGARRRRARRRSRPPSRRIDQRPRRRRGDRRGPHPAPDPRRHRRDPAHQRLRAVGRRRRSPSSSIRRSCPGLPAPVPWREIWVYSPRVEGIHLRGGPIARGGLRWSDRRDDFRTEILGLMKAQLVKNAVIVPTGAKGGFYPKQLPPTSSRDAWLAEGTESLSHLHPRPALGHRQYRRRQGRPSGRRGDRDDGDDPYFVVAADKGTATFSDVANAIAIERGFWLGDAFASGGSNGYDHKAMGITAKGAWVSVQRHFREMGVDVQKQPIRVAGVGDMSGDVFGNGMLLSKAIKLVAAFDHRHIFLDPDPDPAKSWKERKRMFDLPRSTWDDYDKALISKGGGVFPRSQKSIPLSRRGARDARHRGGGDRAGRR